VTIIAAGAMAMLILITALAVDVGSIYLGKRHLQGVADAAALAAANASGDPRSAANAAIAANADGNTSLTTLVTGSYLADSAIPTGSRFTPGATPSNAAQVTLTQSLPLFFGRFVMRGGTTDISAKATATRMDLAAFSIGSRLAAVQGGLPNALLSGLAGTDLNLSVMDYNSLVGANIDVLSFSDALRTQLHLNAATFGETLNTSVTLPQALSALAAVTGDPTAAAALRSMALKVPPTTILLSNLIDLGPLAGQTSADPTSVVMIDSYSVVREMLQIANGQRQVALDLGLSLPGITSTKLTLAIGQRPAHSPWLAVTTDNSVIVRTAQSRLYLDSNVGGAATLGLLSVRLPLFIELAQAQAKLKAISCSGGRSAATVSLDVQPAVGQIAIADVNTAALSDFSTPVTLNRAAIAKSLLVKVTGLANISLGGTNWQSVDFSAADIAAGRVQTVSTNDLTQGVATSLLSGIDLRATALGLGVNLSAVTSAVGGLLTPLAPTLDTLVDQVTGLLGVHVGQADVRVDGLRCGKPILVG
jgi:uncharacterized membrane protein